MEYVHLDYYTDDATALDFFLISENPTVENAFSITIVTGGWQSIDIPLSSYSANLDRVFQFKTVGNGTVYLDNLYFWKAPAAAGTDSSLSALTVDGSSIADFGAFKKSYSVELPAETTVVPTVAATTTDTNASAVVTAATSIPGTTTIDVTAQDGITTTTFSIAFTLEATNSAAAPTPSQDSADVISVYSDAYTDNIATNLNPIGDNKRKLLNSKSTATIPWNTPTSTTRDWITHKQMFLPWNFCIWITRPMTLPRLIFF